MLAAVAYETAISLGVVLLVLAVLVHWTWARRSSFRLQAQITQFNERLDQIESRLEPRSIIPPMSIFLEPIEHRWHVVDELCKRIDYWMLRNRFERIGYFKVDPWEGEELCAYLSEDRLIVAAVRMAKDAPEPYVEFLFDLGDGQRGGTCNPPSSMVRPTEDESGHCFDGKLSSNFSIIARMYDKARELVEQLNPTPIAPDRIAQFYEEAHEQEMAQRVHAGGITELEICDALARQGVRPTQTQVATIQRQWQLAIEDYLLEFSARGKNRQAAGDRILVVHAGSVESFLLAQLNWAIEQMIEDPAQVANLSRELKSLLEQFEPREAVGRFAEAMPQNKPIELVDQIVRPLPADLYALPKVS